jgi:metallophosphoesterase (TIGR00282 family)
LKLNILCIGDIVGKPGRSILANKLGALVRDRHIDCVIANAENAAGGSGLTRQIYDKLLKYGVNLITLGDHAYRKRDIIETLERESNICRPANLSPAASGKEFALYQTAKGPVIAAVSLIGRIFMKPSDCPYAKIDQLLSQLKNRAEIIVVDMHAEATSEKVAMGYYLDGKVSVLFGTHTHVPTADEHILPRGTGYITDVGMTGPHDSVLGRKTESVIKSFRTQMPFPFEVATGDVRINGIICTIDTNSRQTEFIERVTVKSEVSETTSYDQDDGKPEPLVGF